MEAQLSNQVEIVDWRSNFSNLEIPITVQNNSLFLKCLNTLIDQVVE